MRNRKEIGERERERERGKKEHSNIITGHSDTVYVCSGKDKNNVPLVRYVNFDVNVLLRRSCIYDIFSPKCIFYTEILVKVELSARSY